MSVVRKNLAIITYSSYIEHNNDKFVNRALGKFTDTIANYFSQIFFIAAKAPITSSLYANGKPVYSYNFRSGNVILIELYAYTTAKNIIKKIILFLKNTSVLSKIIKKSDYVYIFMPGVSGLIASIIAILYNKDYFLYFGSDWYATVPFRIQNMRYKKILKIILLNLYPMIEKIIAKMAIFCIVAGKKLYNYYSAISNAVYETIPMIQFNESNKLECCELNHTKNANEAKLLFVGPINAIKGIEYLIQSIPILNKQNIDVKLYLVGAIDYEYKKKLDVYACNNHIQNQIFYIGYVSDPKKLLCYYKQVDMLVIPTLAEGFPRVIYEAMLCDLPVIASDIDVIKENLPTTDIIYLVPPRSPEAIAKAIINLFKNEDLRKRQVQMAKLYALSKVSGNAANQFIKIFMRYCISE